MRTAAICSLALTMLLAAPGCGKKESSSEARPAAPTEDRSTEPTAPAERIRVAVDPRIELLSILFRLAGSPEYARATPTAYSRDVDAHFAEFASHPAVVATRALRDLHGIGYNAPPGLAIYLKSATEPALRRALSPAPASLDARWQKVAIPDYLAAVRQFAVDSHFDQFMAEHRDYFRAVEQRYRDALDLAAVTRWFDGFFGPRPHLTAIVVPGLLTGPNNYGATAELTGGATELYQVVQLGQVDDKGLPTVGEGTEGLLVHEMAHGYINPLFAEYRDALEQPGRALFARVAEAMSAQAYPSWETVLDETGVRATTALYLLELRGETAASATLALDERRSFLWIGGLAELFQKEREQADGGNSDGAALAVGTAEYLKRWLADHPDQLPTPPFRGPINGALAAPKAKILYVHPGKTGNSSPLARYVRSTRDQFSAGAKVIGADDYPPKPDQATTHVVYGTPGDSPAVLTLLDLFGWHVTPQSIRLGDREFTGSDLMLVACHPLPGNATGAVVLYTAATEAALAAPNAVFHGPTDWVVARHVGGNIYQVLAKGDFPKSLAGEWHPLPAATNPAK